MHNLPLLTPLLSVAGILIVLSSPEKAETLLRLIVAVVFATIAILLVRAFFQTGSPGTGTIQIAIALTDLFGLFHVLELKRSRA